jgi:hypothetical protein
MGDRYRLDYVVLRAQPLMRHGRDTDSAFPQMPERVQGSIVRNGSTVARGGEASR